MNLAYFANQTLGSPLLAGIRDGFFPPPRSTTAGSVDELFYFILAISLVFFAIIVVAMFGFVWKYRQRPGVAAQPSPSHNNLLEIVWSVIPAILVGVIFFWGFVTFLDMRVPPDDSYEIQVTAKKWSWSFTYPNGHVDNNLHVPVDQPVRLVMASDDVIHSLYIPAFRIKRDLIPGRYGTTWFESHTPGDYTLFCTEYCGTQHSTMLAKVVVHRSGEFEGWLENAANLLNTMTPVEAGEVLYTRRGCVQCHSIDGSAKVGPSFKNAYGSQQEMEDGAQVLVDENYIRESILEPQAKVRAGYKPVMPTYQGQLKDEEILALIAYIKSLSDQAASLEEEENEILAEGEDLSAEAEDALAGGEEKQLPGEDENPAGSGEAAAVDPSVVDGEPGPADANE